jgi:hypothetical protein
MSKKYNEPVVAYCAEDKLYAFIWRGRLYKVQKVIGTWTVNGGWWQKQLAQRRHNVVAAQSSSGGGGVFELYCQGQTKKRFLFKVLD